MASQPRGTKAQPVQQAPPPPPGNTSAKIPSSRSRPGVPTMMPRTQATTHSPPPAQSTASTRAISRTSFWTATTIQAATNHLTAPTVVRPPTTARIPPVPIPLQNGQGGGGQPPGQTYCAQQEPKYRQDGMHWQQSTSTPPPQNRRGGDLPASSLAHAEAAAR